MRTRMASAECRVQVRASIDVLLVRAASAFVRGKISETLSSIWILLIQVDLRVPVLELE